MRGHRTKIFRAAVASGAVALLLATASVPLATSATASGSASARKTGYAASDREARDRSGRWIAYSTAPAGAASGDSYGAPAGSGSDVFMSRVSGGRPKLVAGRSSRTWHVFSWRGESKVWNVCPVFSPNGRMLAYARLVGALSWKAGAARSTIVVIRVGPEGPIAKGRIVLTVPGGLVRCPRWSSNSSRLAYLDHDRRKVVVRGLDGSKWHRASGDPTIHDFDRSVGELVSPTGDLVAKSGPHGIVVSRPDGSDQRVVKDDLGGYPSYGIGGWSPDGRKLLLMKDVGGGFSMRAVSVDPPFASEMVVAHVPVNNARSWPGYGDVSWQPIPDHRRSY